MDAIVKGLSQNWWLFLLQGVLSIVLGVLLLVWPGHALAVLILFIGLLALFNGIVAVFAAIGAEGVRPPGGWRLTQGIVGIVAGLAILRWPGVTALVALFLVGTWAIVTGIVEIVGAIIGRSEIPSAWLVALAGVVSLLFGIAMFAWPTVQALVALIYVVGIYAIVYGLFSCALAFRVRSLPERMARPQAPHGALPA